eukprot:3167494-Prymnesium_polylepis.1
MMAPEAEQPVPPGPALERTDASGAPGLADAEGEANGGARLRRPRRRLTPYLPAGDALHVDQEHDPTATLMLERALNGA